MFSDYTWFGEIYNFVEDANSLKCPWKKLDFSAIYAAKIGTNDECQNVALIFLRNFAEDTNALGRNPRALLILSR